MSGRGRDPHAQITATEQLSVDLAGPLRAGSVCLHVVVAESVFSHVLAMGATAVVGRDADADLRIEHPSVSRKHARISFGPPLTIEDLGARNGVSVDGVRIEKIEELRPRSIVRIGEATLVLQEAAAQRRPRRIWTHDYFEARVEDECARAAEIDGAFSLVRARLVPRDEERVAKIVGALRPGDVVASYGPDDLEMLLLDRAFRDVEILVERFRELVGTEGRVAIASFPQDGRSPEALFTRVAEAVRPRKRATGGASTNAPRLVGKGMRALESLVGQVARSRVNVLLVGETGVGKEVVAAELHAKSGRGHGPYIKLNCAGFTEALLASELFGHERGAFTGAEQAKPGQLELADGGTVFLDEVGELPLAIQPRLLRVIEDKEVTRVGGLKPKKVDVRFVAATNRDLEAEVAAGRFRQDLYFRLNAFTLPIPPLRERPEDIEDLARHFAAVVAQESGAHPPKIAEGFLSALRGYAWPGNVRELRNTIERAILLAQGKPLDVQHLPLEKMRATLAPADPLEQAIADREKKRIVEALAACGGNQSRAAKRLGIARSTLLARMDLYGLPRPLKGDS